VALYIGSQYWDITHKYIALGVCVPKVPTKDHRPCQECFFMTPSFLSLVEGELDFWAYDDDGAGGRI